jgi:diaminopimelate epimerase
MTAKPDRLIPFVKMTGSGNDFMVIDNRSGLISADAHQRLAQLACRRKLSVGADGLILIEKDPEVDFQWQFYNADGSKAEMCGNGARCAARFAHLKGLVAGRQMAFRTLAGIIQAEIRGERVKIKMTPPHGLKLNLHVAVEDQAFALHFINTGVPHVVVPISREAALRDTDVLHWGRVLRYHVDFQPAGTNVNFAHVRGPQDIVVRTYERGVEAETLACGTGSIASALVAAATLGAVSPVQVQTESGETLSVYFDATSSAEGLEFGDVYLEGDAKVVYEANLWDETLRQ